MVYQPGETQNRADVKQYVLHVRRFINDGELKIKTEKHIQHHPQ
jgi:hypothetical protein